MTAILSFQFYYTPVLVFTGAVGNVLTVFVLQLTKLRALSSSCYLAVLAINDNVFLICLFLVWLKMVGVDMFNRHFFCQSIVYVTSVCSFLNIWLVMSFTFERYVAVKYPFSLQSKCTMKRAKIVVGCLTIASLVIYSPLALFSRPMPLGNSSIVCTIDPKWSHAANVFNSFDFVVAYILPGTIIACLNVSIGKALKSLSILRKTMLNESKFEENKYRNHITQNKTTKMLLIVSTVFLLLNLPSYVMRMMTYLIQLDLVQIKDLHFFQNMQQWCLELFYTSFGINFYLYCLSGHNFRKALSGIFGKILPTRGSHNGTPDTRSTSNSSSGRNRKNKSINLEFINFSPKARELSKHPKFDV